MKFMFWFSVAFSSSLSTMLVGARGIPRPVFVELPRFGKMFENNRAMTPWLGILGIPPTDVAVGERASNGPVTVMMNALTSRDSFRLIQSNQTRPCQSRRHAR